MRENAARALAVIIAISGLILLYFVSENIETSALALKDISLEKEGEMIKTCGEISNTRVSNNHIFWDLRDNTGSTRIVVFNYTSLLLKKRHIDLFSVKDGFVCVTGIVDEYPPGSGRINIIYRKSDLEFK